MALESSAPMAAAEPSARVRRLGCSELNLSERPRTATPSAQTSKRTAQKSIASPESRTTKAFQCETLLPAKRLGQEARSFSAALTSCSASEAYNAATELLPSA